MPAAPPVPFPIVAAPPAPALRPVLLVSDTSSLRRLKRHYLERAGYAVTEVEDGQQALAQLRASAVPLLVVMNTRIPRLDAAGILRAVVDEPRLRRHAFVLTTALAHELPPALRGLTTFLQVPVLGKPFTEQEFLAAVAGGVHRLALAPSVSQATHEDDRVTTRLLHTRAHGVIPGSPE